MEKEACVLRKRCARYFWIAGKGYFNTYDHVKNGKV